MSSLTREAELCCDDKRNVITIEGTHTCAKCGKVLDMLTSHYTKADTIGVYTDNMILEFCERANIDPQTAYYAEKLFTKYSRKFIRLQKLPLRAASIYVACKKEGVPRTMKEISSVTECDVRALGKYEKVISCKHYPVSASGYVERFARKLGLDLKKVKLVHENINNYNKKKSSTNPSSVACAHIYNLFPDVVDINQLSVVSGVPMSTIKRLNKTISY